MKKLMLLLCLFGSTQVWSAELNADSLQGAWVIKSMGGLVDDEGDMWEFEGGLFYQNLGGRRIAPDKFKVMGKTIDLDGYEIKVLEYDGSHMKANMGGAVYELTKK